MPIIDTLIIGAGQAGLAASRLLTADDHEHVLLERGRVAERWLSSTWDSLRLLTPNWMSRLPRWTYTGDRPDGYMSAAEVADYLSAYGRSFGAPVQSQTSVHHVWRTPTGFEVITDRESWRAANVIIATGWCDRPAIPAVASRLPPSLEQLSPAQYRHPGQLAAGGVLVVGASATGVQLADELRRAGREVYLAVGQHTRVPRRYRGRDIFYWLERIGALDRRIDETRSVANARREPSLQLVGRGGGATIDLSTLAANGVTLTGRLTAIDGSVARFAEDLQMTVGNADRRLRRVLDRIDAYVDAHGLRVEPQSPLHLLQPVPLGTPSRLDLRRAGISTVIWATGHRRSYPWLHVPVLDADGEIAHRDGITRATGLYVLGQRFQRTRRSNFLDGVGADAAVVTGHLLGQTQRLVA